MRPVAFRPFTRSAACLTGQPAEAGASESAGSVVEWVDRLLAEPISEA